MTINNLSIIQFILFTFKLYLKIICVPRLSFIFFPNIRTNIKFVLYKQVIIKYIKKLSSNKSSIPAHLLQSYYYF